MDLPQPPQDTELKNIIDKLAQFVARNGPEFEQMTKNKQKGNSKFQFLFGGEYFNYYQYKVTTEQAICKQQQQNGNASNPNWNSSVLNGSEIESLKQQQESLREQIKQSEQNLSAQHAVLLQQQQAQVEINVSKSENEALQIEAENCEIFLEDIYNILQPIIDNCTKDSISNGKSWILQHATTKEKIFCILHCLLNKVIQGSTFQQKLHVIYLLNDLMHHCARKNSADLRGALEETVAPMFCNANIGATEEQKKKLDKLLRLWETKLNFLSKDLIEQMKSPVQTYQQYQADKMAKYSEEIGLLAQQTKTTFDNYQSQHQAYVCHALQQIMELQQQKQALEQQQQQSLQTPLPSQTQPTSNNLIPLDGIQESIQQQVSQPIPIDPSDYQLPSTNPPPPPSMAPLPAAPPPDNYMPPIDPSFPPPNLMQPPGSIDHHFSQPPPSFFPPPGVFPDFSRPPPGFMPKLEPVEELLPTNPYYDLPAGLIVPLIKLEDTSYKPLDPKDIRLPPPAPPSERLLAALDAFYSLPTHERPRDSEGWEKLGLYEYYKAKNNAKKDKEDQIANGMRLKSRSPSPVDIPVVKEPSPPKRRYTSKSPSPPQQVQHHQQTGYSHRGGTARRSRSRSRTRSRSRSPRRRRRSGRGGRRRSLSRSPSRSPVRRSSRSPIRRSSRSPTRRSSRSPIRRTPTPPHVHGFGGSSYMRSSDLQELDSSNKGHQMLKKMGWGGSGLGANEQGIDAPISGGDVRDKQDQFKGVGCNLNDPYENFRKNKGAAFITRMKARAEERANENKFVDY
ncbi:hypothetical protein WA026_023092 [Henosepilachna vigintioctopunctata]|uniref:Calcium homeostasis endoplasmic reticulum protein n=1 Tax=Henosepilachna vigintioctopunctata TaxID=420089 RepID=A0AAW1UER6_9CUCU